MRLTRLGRVVVAAWLVLVVLGVLTWTATKDANNMRYWQECSARGTCPAPHPPITDKEPRP